MKMLCPITKSESIQISLNDHDAHLVVECEKGLECENVIQGRCAWAKHIPMKFEESISSE